MRITPNLIDSDCSSLTGWTSDHVSVSDGKFVFDPAYDGFITKSPFPVEALIDDFTIEISAKIISTHEVSQFLAGRARLRYYCRQASLSTYGSIDIVIEFFNNDLVIWNGHSWNDLSTTLSGYVSHTEYQTFRFEISTAGTVNVYLTDSTHTNTQIGTDIPCFIDSPPLPDLPDIPFLSFSTHSNWAGVEAYLDSVQAGEGLETVELAKTESLDISIESVVDGTTPSGLFKAVEHLDVDIESHIDGTMTAGAHIAKNTLDIEFTGDVTGDVAYVKKIDVMPLFPEQYRSSQLLIDLVAQINRYVGLWSAKIDELAFLQNPYTVDEVYAVYLAQLIGLDLEVTATTTIQEIRGKLATAVDWYKIKGTYQSLLIAIYMSGFRVNLYDMYTADYLNFVKVAWFVGEQGENPGGLGPEYYKSAHFGVEVVLDRLYGSGYDVYLWRLQMSASVEQTVQGISPISTVPHITLLLNPIVREDGAVYTTPERVKTILTPDWTSNHIFFDDGNSFDDGHFFDYTDEAFLPSIRQWVVGSGSKGLSPDIPGFALGTPETSGDVESVTQYPDRIEIEILIPSGDQYTDLSELAVYSDITGTPVLFATFPDVAKSTYEELRIKITVSLAK